VAYERSCRRRLEPRLEVLAAIDPVGRDRLDQVAERVFLERQVASRSGTDRLARNRKRSRKRRQQRANHSQREQNGQRRPARSG
jgi:hypothetical protein